MQAIPWSALLAAVVHLLGIPPLPPGAVQRITPARSLHPGGVERIAFSPTAPVVATAGNDKYIRLWDTSTGRALRTIPVEGKPAALTFTPDGKSLVWAAGKSVVVWDLARREAVHVVKDHQAAVSAVAITPDGRTLATAGDDGKIRQWDLATGKLRDTFAADKHLPVALAFVDGGKTLVSGGSEGTVHFWPTGGGPPKLPLQVPRGIESHYAFAPDGSRLAVAVNFNDPAVPASARVHVYELGTGKSLWEKSWISHQVAALAFAPDGKSVAVGTRPLGLVGGVSTNIRVEVFGAATGVSWWCYAAWPTPAAALAYSADSKLLAVGGPDGLMRIRRTDDGDPAQPAADQAGPFLAVALAPDGRTVAAADASGQVNLWNVATGKVLWSRRPLQGTAGSLAFSPTGEHLLFVTQETRAVLLNAATGEVVALPKDTDLAVYGIAAFSPDGKTLAVCGRKIVGLWDVAGQTWLRQLTDDNLPASAALAWSADGRLLATGSQDGRVRLWDPRSGRLLATFTGHGQNVTAVAISPDGLLLASGDVAGKVVLWDLHAGKAVWEGGVREWVPQLEFAADGRVLLVRSGVEAVRFFDVFQGKNLGSLPHGIRAMALTADRARLATAQEDGSVVVWTVAELYETPPLPAAKLTDKEAEALWTALAADPAAALAARRQLAADPARAVPLLKARLRPAPAPDIKRIRAMIGDLGNDKFKVRESAMEELAKLGEHAAAALEAALNDSPPLEAKLRIEQLLRKLATTSLPPESLRELRAVAALELMATAEARALLEELADGAPGRLTQAARGTLKRLAPAPSPHN